MQTYYSVCIKHTDPIRRCPTKTSHMTNKKLKGKSRCADCVANKSFSDKIKNKIELEIIMSQFLLDY